MKDKGHKRVREINNVRDDDDDDNGDDDDDDDDDVGECTW